MSRWVIAVARCRRRGAGARRDPVRAPSTGRGMVGHQPGPRAGARAADRRAVRARQRRRPEATPPRGDRVAGLARRPARPDLAGPVAGQRGRRRRRGVARRSRAVAARERPILAGAGRRDGRGVTVAICADLVRPSTGWLVAAVPRGGALVRGMAQARDPEGFARLRRQCERDAHLPAAAGTHTLHRAAVILGAKGGVLAEVTVGDVLELLDAEAAVSSAARWGTPRRSTEPCTAGDLRVGRAEPAAGAAQRRSTHARASSSTGSTWPAGRCATCWWTTCANAHRRWTTAACARSPPTWATCSGRTSNATIPASTACTYPPRSPPRGSSGCAPGRRRSPPPPARRRRSPWNASATANA